MACTVCLTLACIIIYMIMFTSVSTNFFLLNNLSSLVHDFINRISLYYDVCYYYVASWMKYEKLSLKITKRIPRIKTRHIVAELNSKLRMFCFPHNLIRNINKYQRNTFQISCTNLYVKRRLYLEFQTRNLTVT